MSLIFLRDIINSAPERWKSQYTNYDGRDGYEKGLKTARLEALRPDERTAENIERIIGNDTWTTLKCEVCNEPADALYSFIPSYADSGTSVCLACVSGAHEQLLAAREADPS